MSEEYILHGPPAIEPNPDKSIGEFFFEKLTYHGNKTAQVDAVTEKSHTFEEIHSLSLRLAETMRYGTETNKWHIGCGDYVGICSENNIDYCIPVLATFYLGAAAAPLNPTYSKREIEHALNISKPKVVFTSKTRMKDIVDVARTTNFVQSVILMNEIRKDSHSNQTEKSSTNGDNVICINSLIYPENKFIPSLPLIKDFPKVHIKDQVALVMCSSGTTGLPKGVMLTQHNILSTLCRRGDDGQIFSSEESMMGLLPFFHAYGLMAVLHCFNSGMKLVALPHFDGDLFLRSIERHKVSMLLIVPPLAVFLAKDPRVAKYDLSSVHDIFCGAASLGKDTEEQVQRIVNTSRERVGLPPCSISQGYGLTETTLGVTVISKTSKYGSIGTLAPGIACKVIDMETGKSLGPNKEGEFCFHGSAIMKGYLGDPKATASTIDKDGWLRTGDVGYYDEDGYFYIVDRIKELIKYKAFQVPPAELEAILLTHPAIEDAAVIGIPDESAGELPMAMVVKRPGKDLTEAEVVKFVAGQVSPQKRLRGGVRFVGSIPKTASGKILRRVLREAFKAKL